MRSLEVFEAGRELTLTVGRAGRETTLGLVPSPLAPGQAEAISAYMARLASCMKNGQGCPCPLDHSAASSEEDFRSAYRQFGDAIRREGGRTVLTISRDAAGSLSYASSPVALPPGFGIGPEDDGMLWQRIEALGQGGRLEVEITIEDPESRRIRILTPFAGEKVQ